jgi:hypothetical protein
MVTGRTGVLLARRRFQIRNSLEHIESLGCPAEHHVAACAVADDPRITRVAAPRDRKKNWPPLSGPELAVAMTPGA